MKLFGALATTLRLVSCGAPSAPSGSGSLDQLRARASLGPCPQGVAAELPDLRLPCLAEGPKVAVCRPPGKALLGNFYNTSCAPCQDELPVLVAYARSPGSRPLLGVDAEDSTSDALQFVTDFGGTWPVVEDQDGRLFRRNAGGWPVTIAVRSDGTVADKHVGQFHSTADIAAFSAKALGA